MQERVKIVLFARIRIFGFPQEFKVIKRLVVSDILGDELIGERGTTADDDDATVGEDLIGGVPAAVGEGDGELDPVALVVVAGGEGAELVMAVVEAAGLEKGAVGDDGGRGAPGVGLDGEGAERVGGEVVEDRVGGAVELEGHIAGVVAAATVGEGDVGGAEVGAVEDDDPVVAHDLHVHGRDADAALKEEPVAASRGGGGGGGGGGCKRRRQRQ